MTVSTTSTKVSYAGNGSTVAFAFSYPIFEQTDLRIILKVDATGVETVQTLTAHYTVSASPWTSGGTVTMVTAPASGETLIVKSDIPSTQGTDYPTAGNFPAASHEDALDRLTLIFQQMEETIGRSLTLAEATALSDFVVPDPGTNVVLYYDGAAFSWPVLTTLTPDSVATTAFTQTLLDDATAAAFMTTLGITAFAQTLLDDTTAAAARATLELEGGALKNPSVSAKTGAYTVVAADDGGHVSATSGTWSLITAAAASVLGDGFSFTFTNDGTGVVTFNPQGAETVNGFTTWACNPGEGFDARCDGTNWFVTSHGGFFFSDQVITASGTWTKPAGLKFIEVGVQAGGGGSGGSGSTNYRASGGGGGGGYAWIRVNAADLGATETATVGAGGVAGTSSGNGGAGGTSSFTITGGTTLQATGGSGSTKNGALAGVSGAVGGVGSNGTINIGGQGGGSGMTTDSSSRPVSGCGGSSFMGGGGRSIVSNTAGQAPVGGYGGGAGGASTMTGGAKAGAAGAAGAIFIREYK